MTVASRAQMGCINLALTGKAPERYVEIDKLDRFGQAAFSLRRPPRGTIGE
jgi:hypothetical protein